MPAFTVTLSRITDTSFPEFGLFEIRDISGGVIAIHEKLPVAGLNDLQLKLPTEVKLRCKIISRSQASVLIDINEPDGLEDARGRTQFWVGAELVEP